MLRGGFGIVVGAVFVGLATDLAVEQLSMVKFAFILGAFALLIPTMLLKNAKAFWLFLLVLTMPLDISKWLTTAQDPQALVDQYGMPASGTISVTLYLTDVVLMAMLLPWLVRISLRRERFYFPKIGYLFVFYLAWALLVSVINAESFYLSMIALWRETLYFLSFIYLINNVTTRLQFRTVVVAIFLVLIIGAGSVITFFELGIGTDYIAFSGLRDQPPPAASRFPKPGKTPVTQNLTVNIQGGLGSEYRGQGSAIKRSQGIFAHPAVAAALCGLMLPIVLAYLFAARTHRDRILFFMVWVGGVTGLVLTFSRAGLLAFIVGTVVCFAVAGWSGLISRRVFARGTVILIGTAVLSMPLAVIYLQTRPESYDMRFNLFWAALQGYWQDPILGVGLNNSTAAMKAGKQELQDLGIKIAKIESVDNHYLALLTEVGPVGFILFFVFFGKLVMIALRAMQQDAVEMKPLLVGIIGGFASVATQDVADNAIAPHTIAAPVWLFAALIVATARYIHLPSKYPRSSTMRHNLAAPDRPPATNSGLEVHPVSTEHR
jgi:hypothetical protein